LGRFDGKRQKDRKKEQEVKIDERKDRKNR
jgi:hypothetical protein